MPRHLVVLLTVLLLAGAASAQNWFGVRSGYPLGVTVHCGVGNALANGADLRVSARVVVGPGGRATFGVGFDALVDVYADGAIGLSGGTARIPTFGAAVGFNWDS